MFSPKYGGGYGSGGYGFASCATLPPPGRCTLVSHPAAQPGTDAYLQVALPQGGMAGATHIGVMVSKLM